MCLHWRGRRLEGDDRHTALFMHMQAFLSPVKSSPSSKPEKERAAMLSKKGMDAFLLKYKVGACSWPG